MNIYSYNPKSESSAALAKALGVKRIKHEGSNFKGNNRKTVINWGASRLPQEVMNCNVINKPDAVGLCTNKLDFFRFIAGKGVSIPDWTNDSAAAMKWVAEGHTVCARTVLQGHSAKGLVLMTKDDLKSHVNAPLYTKYIPKLDEYRVHVFNNRVIDIQRKALRNGWEDEHGKANYRIRNLANGFIYMRNGVNPPEPVTREALSAVRVMGLDFGAVDIIWNQKQQSAYVLEINTAPGLEGTTLENYTEAFKVLK